MHNVFLVLLYTYFLCVKKVEEEKRESGLLKQDNVLLLTTSHHATLYLSYCIIHCRSTIIMALCGLFCKLAHSIFKTQCTLCMLYFAYSMLRQPQPVHYKLIKNFVWEDQSEKVFYKCHIYASVLYCVVIEHPSVLY